MGIEIAEEAARQGAKVDLVLGPTDLRPSRYKVNVIPVISAAQMEQECMARFQACDIAVLAAAVADYTPQVLSGTKIKRTGSNLNVSLKPTSDIAAQMGALKRKDQLLVGFALETDNEEINAFSKLKKKNLDLIVLNSLKDEGAGFGHKTNKISIIDRYNNIDKFELKLKQEAAADIVKRISTLMQTK
jgi:phosphopantothenoylcysteine decarboxylase/phosphopantothenate--cysteine ligase